MRTIADRVDTSDLATALERKDVYDAEGRNLALQWRQIGGVSGILGPGERAHGIEGGLTGSELARRRGEPWT